MSETSPETKTENNIDNQEQVRYAIITTYDSYVIPKVFRLLCKYYFHDIFGKKNINLIRYLLRLLYVWNRSSENT